MIGLLHKGLLAIATWPVVCLLFLAFILCFQLFDWRRQKLGAETKVLDASFWYKPSDAKQFFENGGKNLWLISTGTRLSRTATPFLKGLSLLSRIPFFNMLMIPETTLLPDREAAKVFPEVQQMARFYFWIEPTLKYREKNFTVMILRMRNSWQIVKRMQKYSSITVLVVNTSHLISSTARASRRRQNKKPA